MTKWELGEEFGAYKMARESYHLTYTQWLEEMAMRYLDPPGNARQPEVVAPSAEVPVPTVEELAEAMYQNNTALLTNVEARYIAKVVHKLLTKGRGGV
jgi:hypothetical protein